MAFCKIKYFYIKARDRDGAGLITNLYVEVVVSFL